MRRARFAPSAVVACALVIGALLVGGCDSDAPTAGSSAVASEPPLSRWFSGGFAGKTVVVWGNSTVSHAPYFFEQLRSYAIAGDALEGLEASRILNYGNNGASLAALLDGMGDYPLDSVIAARPDLLIIRGPLINDVRLGSTDLQRAEQLLALALERLQAGLPNAGIVLITENSLLSADTSGHGWVQPVSAAQRYTDIMRAAVLAMRERFPRVQVHDIMHTVYGTVSMPRSPMMRDQLHPSEAGQRAEANEIVGVIGRR